MKLNRLVKERVELAIELGGIAELPSGAVKRKKPKYRPYVCKVVGYECGLIVVRFFKSVSAAERFAATLSKAKLFPVNEE